MNGLFWQISPENFKAHLTLELYLAAGISHATNNYQDWWCNPAYFVVKKFPQNWDLQLI